MAIAVTMMVVHNVPQRMRCSTINIHIEIEPITFVVTDVTYCYTGEIATTRCLTVVVGKELPVLDKQVTRPHIERWPS